MTDRADRNGSLLPNQRHLFDIPVDVVFLNCANIAPQPRPVRAAGEAALERLAHPGEITTADWFADVERLRGLFARLIGADANGVALIPATSVAPAPRS